MESFIVPHCRKSQPVDVWTVSLDEPRPSFLTPDERARGARFHFERDRVHWVNGRSTLRTVLAEYLNRDPAALNFVLGPHGKPSLENADGLEFNISHSRGWAMIAVSREIPVGIDIENIREDLDIAKLLRRLGETELPESKIALFHVWTRREAKTKALGGALMEIPAGDLRAVDLEAPPGFAASLALAGHDPRVIYRM